MTDQTLFEQLKAKREALVATLKAKKEAIHKRIYGEPQERESPESAEWRMINDERCWLPMNRPEDESILPR